MHVCSLFQSAESLINLRQYSTSGHQINSVAHLGAGKAGVAVRFGLGDVTAVGLPVQQAQKSRAGCGPQRGGVPVEGPTLGREQHLACCRADPLLQHVLRRSKTG